ncbi:AAA family ATPase [Thermosulfuriphilus sp.]
MRLASHVVFPRAGGGRETGDRYPGKDLINFDLKPEELAAYLDEHIIRQDEAKAILATKICTHFNRIKYMLRERRRPNLIGNIKNNIIMIGPTGVGKTFMVKLIANKIGVPFVKGDATKFSETGYVGGDIEDLIRDLVQEADGDLEKAQFGIVYLDEIDKIAASQGLIGPDVSRTGVQRALLKPMEETEVDLRVPHDPISQIEAIEHYRRTGKRQKRTINTRHILFIVSGAFNGLADIIKRRMRRQGIGFGADLDTKDQEDNWLRHVRAEDLIEYGFESEFIGRLPVIAVFDELKEEDLYEILRNPNSTVVVNKKQDFKAYGIELVFEDEALKVLARQAAAEKTGARALVRVVERALLPFEKTLPTSDIRRLVVTPELVEDPKGWLAYVLNDPDSPDLAARFERALEEELSRLKAFLKDKKAAFFEGLGLSLSEDRLELITLLSRQEDLDINTATEEFVLLLKQIRNFERSFKRRSGLEVVFSDEAANEIVRRGLTEGQSTYALCDRLLNILEYGLRLIQERTGRDSFVIMEEAVHNPELYINRLIREAFRPIQT